MKKMWGCYVALLLGCACAGWGATVYVDSGSPANGPGTGWSNAWHSIQDAVNIATNGDVVLVTNGVYRSGAQIGVTNAITVTSVNGAAVTTVDGDDTYRCFNLGDVACTISGFTITRGCATNTYPYDRGGGITSAGYTPVVSECTLSSNRANYGGACAVVRLQNCVLSGNTAVHNGGACNHGLLRNCLLSDNSAGGFGGAVIYGTLENCTLMGNSAGDRGGACYGGTLTNSIIHFNSATNQGDNCYDQGSLSVSHSCTTPDPGGTSNITGDPRFVNAAVGNYRLSSGSPCINAGTNEAWMAGATDLDGNPRINGGTVDMGAYEFYDAALVDITNPAGGGATVSDTVDAYTIGGTNNAWTVGNLWWTNAANGESGEWPVAGGEWLVEDIPLAFYANTITVHGSNVVGAVVQDSVIITRDPQHSGNSPIHYVSTTGAAIWPYTTWADAAINIQAAVDAAAPGDTVLVTNGTYASGSQITVSKPITIESVNGRGATFVDGQNTHRCFHLQNAACTISSLTITDGNAGSGNGGGIYCLGTTPVITNCTLSGNSAGRQGGGCFRGTLHSCTISGNSANVGGGIFSRSPPSSLKL